MNNMLRVLLVLIKRDKKIIGLLAIVTVLVFMALYLIMNIAVSLVEESIPQKNVQVSEKEKKDIFKKIYVLENKVRENPKNSYLHRELGVLYYEIGEKDKAKIELFRAVKLSDSTDYGAKYELVKLYIDMDEYDIAKALLFEIPTDKTKNGQLRGDLLVRLASKAIERNNFLDATKLYEMSLGYYNPKSAAYKDIQDKLGPVYEKTADYYYSQKNKEKTAEYLTHSLEKKPIASTYFKFGLINEIEGNFSEAIKYYNRAYKMNKLGINAFVYNNALKRELDKNRSALSESDIIQYGLLVKNTDKDAENIVLLKNVQISNVSTEYLRISDNQNLIDSMLKFQIMNVSKKQIDYLKVRVVFMNDNRVFDYKDLYIADKNRPFERLSYTNLLSVNAKPVLITKDKNIKAYVYLSLSNGEDKWFLNRIIVISTP